MCYPSGCCSFSFFLSPSIFFSFTAAWFSPASLGIKSICMLSKAVHTSKTTAKTPVTHVIKHICTFLVWEGGQLLPELRISFPICLWRSKTQDQICSAVFTLPPTRVPMQASCQLNVRLIKTTSSRLNPKTAATWLVTPIPLVLLLQFVKLASAMALPAAASSPASLQLPCLQAIHPTHDGWAPPSQRPVPLWDTGLWMWLVPTLPPVAELCALSCTWFQDLPLEQKGFSADQVAEEENTAICCWASSPRLQLHRLKSLCSA